MEVLIDDSTRSETIGDKPGMGSTHHNKLVIRQDEIFPDIFQRRWEQQAKVTFV